MSIGASLSIGIPYSVLQLAPQAVASSEEAAGAGQSNEQSFARDFARVKVAAEQTLRDSSPTKSLTRLRQAAKPLVRYKNSREYKNQILEYANNAALSSRPLGQAVAAVLIAAVHTRIKPEALAVMKGNAEQAMALFAGIPYRYGSAYVKNDGSLNNGKLNCIGLCNIFGSLVAGMPGFTFNVYGPEGGVIGDVQKKPEFQAAGLYPDPVVRQAPAAKGPALEKLLANYGSYFNVQVYYADGREAHSIIVYREGDEYCVGEAQPGNAVVFDQSFQQWLREFGDSYVSLSFYLLDTNRARDFTTAKPRQFLFNLERSTRQARPLP